MKNDRLYILVKMRKLDWVMKCDMKIYIGLLLLLFTMNCYATPESTLFASVKGNSICLFTKGNYKKITDNQIVFYMGEIIQDQEFKSSFAQTYTNIQDMPTSESHCILIDSAKFKHKVPYYLYLESDKSYSQRICVDHQNNKIILTKVEDVFNCGSKEYDYSGRSWWQIILSWLGLN
ncbi:NF045616 family extracytoplasmic (lipo)protein [Acinetobacter bereziniae]|uniref:NF045616 family extracytoplasmic (lipo)protein n=1 Tax=Acinetobacter bereziniae TaxID=106648 RepID=UPI001250A340|nr:NF045616 family extracytoplasmic (lipo)protein [Acinetobacter bereziniae]